MIDGYLNACACHSPLGPITYEKFEGGQVRASYVVEEDSRTVCAQIGPQGQGQGSYQVAAVAVVVGDEVDAGCEPKHAAVRPAAGCCMAISASGPMLLLLKEPDPAWH